MNAIADIIARFFQIYCPVHRSTVLAVNDLIKTALHNQEIEITSMTNEKAIQILTAAKAAFLACKSNNETLLAELIALREQHAEHADVVVALNGQIENLAVQDAEIDAVIADIAEAFGVGEETPPAAE